MSTYEPARRSIQPLIGPAHRGDSEAIAALRDIALQAIAALNSLTFAPPNHPGIPESIRGGVAAAHDLAKQSHHWPVIIPALEDGRDKIVASRIPSTLGESLPYPVKIVGKDKPRCSDNSSRLGFTFGVFLALEKAKQFPIGVGPDEIIATCMGWLEHDCKGDWDGFPWPDQVISEAKRDSHRKTPAKHVLRKWITEGVRTLVW